MTTKAQAAPEGTRAIIRAFQIIEQLCHTRKDKRINELATETSLNKATVYRILQTLRSLGYVEQREDNDSYYATMKILSVSNELLGGMQLRTLARPAIEKLVDQAKQSAHLSIMDAGSVVIVEKIETDASFRVVSHIGRRSSSHSTSTGKVLLSLMEQEELERFIEKYPLESHTPHTICNKLRLFEELATIRQRGYAVDRQENSIGVSCIAAPIFDYTGLPVAAVSVTGATLEIEKAEETLSTYVCTAAASISRAMGFHR